MKRAREVVLGLGGIEHSRVFTRIWLALFGEWSWDDLPALPPEVILLPPWFPLNVYDFACWARQTIVPLTIVGSHRPVRPLPFSLSELRVGERREVVASAFDLEGPAPAPRPRAAVVRERPIRKLRELSRRLACEWILQRQEADGSWGGIQPPWVYSVLALHLEGYPLDHPRSRARCTASGASRSSRATSGGSRRVSRRSGTRARDDRAARRGCAPDHPALVKAAEWTLREEVRIPGDWCVRRPDLPYSGWAFEFDNDRYPDVDDTAEVILALRAARTDDDGARLAALERAIAWTVGMQSSTAASPRSTPTTRATCAASSRSATSAR
jgi:squalene-hopene/tetraprenyl-beta-curcumene cyclase